MADNFLAKKITPAYRRAGGVSLDAPHFNLLADLACVPSRMRHKEQPHLSARPAAPQEEKSENYERARGKARDNRRRGHDTAARHAVRSENLKNDDTHALRKPDIFRANARGCRRQLPSMQVC